MKWTRFSRQFSAHPELVRFIERRMGDVSRYRSIREFVRDLVTYALIRPRFDDSLLYQKANSDVGKDVFNRKWQKVEYHVLYALRSDMEMLREVVPSVHSVRDRMAAAVMKYAPINVIETDIYWRWIVRETTAGDTLGSLAYVSFDFYEFPPHWLLRNCLPPPSSSTSQ